MKNLAETEKETIANLRLSKSSEEDLKSHYEKQIKGKYFIQKKSKFCPNIFKTHNQLTMYQYRQIYLKI